MRGPQCSPVFATAQDKNTERFHFGTLCASVGHNNKFGTLCASVAHKENRSIFGTLRAIVAHKERFHFWTQCELWPTKIKEGRESQ